ncbi:MULTISPECIES: hypothetical protein [Deefgea]|uniref:DUF4234 domain-containing protein n=1 Tax=Deefgea chitinilytica TaxID=570276 RepID=A0ABS2CFK2_9NEIS|nr:MULTISPECIES: hypothetical protein [Deefgea]MBM5572925.1 hypothetical protein [Deefgea chitinilytica]MBM9890161.1 hypothetical protein [Deefgea sp. CFH1-16]
MDRKEIITLMKSQSTWRLYFFSMFSLGIYTAYYIQQQSQKLAQIPNMPPISSNFINSTIAAYGLGAAFTVASFFVPPEHTINLTSTAFALISNVMALLWAFQMRQRLNTRLELSPKYADWFHGGWTFLFTALYINYKINQLHADQDLGIAS